MGAYISSIDQNDYFLSDSATQVNAGWTLGPLFVGWIVNIFMCGVVLVWACDYARRAKGDRMSVKIAVGTAVVFQCATALVNLVSIMQHGMAQDRSNDAISLVFRSDGLAPTLGAVVSLAAESFFAQRCYSVLPKKSRGIFAVVIAIMIIGGFGGALGTTVVEYVNGGKTDSTRGASIYAYAELYDLAMIWLWCNVGTDITISSLLLFRLWQSRKDVDVALPGSGQRADTLINSLMRLSFETAILTTVCAMTAAFLYVYTTECTNLSYAFSCALPGLYCLSLLWAAKARHRMQHELDPTTASHSIQLVWNLAEATPSAALQQSRLEQYSTGNHLSVALRRSLAPAKANSKLGQKVSLLTISEKEKKVIVDPYAFIDEIESDDSDEEEVIGTGGAGSPREIELSEGSESESEREDEKKRTNYSIV